MTNESSQPRRFPIGLTLATLIGVAILVALGLWQVQRLTWKEALLARIDRLESAAAAPAVTVLDDASSASDLDMVRVRLECLGLASADFVELYGLKDGQAGRRLISA